MKKMVMMAMVMVLVLGAAQAVFAEDLQARLQTLLDRTLAENSMAPGLSLWVTCPPAGLDWAGAAGAIDLDSGTALRPEHTFRIASNTKTYVAVAILKLVEEGRLDLDASISPYLPRHWRQMLADDGYDLYRLTFRRVLSHTAGLNDHASDDRYAEAIYADPHHEWTAQEQITRLVEWFDPVGEPDEIYSYSDDGYILLGRVLEEVTGQPLGLAVHQLLDYEALGLNATWWELTEEAPAGAGDRAHQHISGTDTFDWHPSLDLHGGGGLLTDTRDLGLFMRLLLKGGILSDGVLGEMVGGGTPDYRLGLIATELDGRFALGHSGFWNTFAYHVPGLDLTVSGCLLSHDALRGTDLAGQVVELVNEALAED